MSALVGPRVAAIWALLVCATLASWWLGAEHALPGAEAAGVTVLVLAFIKVHLVGMHFMDLRRAPTPLRLAYDGWCSLVASLVVAFYLSA